MACLTLLSRISPHVRVIFVAAIALSHIQALSWCNESWHCAHDLSSPCPRHYSLVLIGHQSSCPQMTSLLQQHQATSKPSLGVATSHGIAPMACQATSLHKALHHCAIIRRGRLHYTPCHYDYWLHIVTCCEAPCASASKACSCALLASKALHWCPYVWLCLSHLTSLELLIPTTLKSILGYFRSFWERH